MFIIARLNDVFILLLLLKYRRIPRPGSVRAHGGLPRCPREPAKPLRVYRVRRRCARTRCNKRS